MAQQSCHVNSVLHIQNVIQCPVVQIIVSLTMSLVEDSFSPPLLINSIVVMFFAENVLEAFALQKLLTLFWQKWHLFTYITFEKVTSR